MKNSIQELSESDFYNLKIGEVLGIYYYKSEFPRWHCAVILENEIIRNVWNVEKFAFEWMNKFTKQL